MSAKRIETPLTAAQMALAAEPKHLRIVDCFADRIRRRLTGTIADEVESDSYHELCRAARDYDPSRGLTFEVYLRWRLHRRMRSTIREHDGHGITMVPCKRIRTSAGSPGRLEVQTLEVPAIDGVSRTGTMRRNLIPSRDVPVEQDVDFRDYWAMVVASLNCRYAEAATLYFLDGLCYREIGARMSFSRARAGQIVQRATQTIRTVLMCELKP
jgi:RNA polymerase sigma factor (sigma-70 family)